MIRIVVKAENEEKVRASLASTDGKIRFACATGLARGLQIAVGKAFKDYLSGPRPKNLDVRTGRLRNAVASEVEVNGNQIIGRIGDNMPYAAFHEFGFHGTEEVRAHTRIRGWLGKGGRQRKTMKYVRSRKWNATLGRFEEQPGYWKDIRPEEVKTGLSNFSSIEDVRAYTRKVNYVGRQFLRPALENTDLMAEVTAELRKVKDA